MKSLIVLILVFVVNTTHAQSSAGTIPQPETPHVSGDYIHIYDPAGDVFPGPDTKDLKSGSFYPSWQPNDHCFIKGGDKRWHSFGITHPTSETGQSRHQGEFLSFHAVSGKETFAGSLKDRSWIDKPKVLAPQQRPGESAANHAPTIVKQGDVYKMVYGPAPFRMATSPDLYDWTPVGPMAVNEKSGRDPSLSLIGDTYYLVYCAGNSVQAATSRDLQTWSQPVEIFRPEIASYQCESPTLVKRKGQFYLFWCLWDTADKNGNGYGNRSFVYSSDDPLDFQKRPLLTELQTHAPEVFQDEKGDWFISSAQYPSRGISVAKLIWK